MEIIPCGFGASTTAQGLQSAPSSDQGFQLTFQIWASKSGDNGMMTDPYPHPQQMKAFEHLVYVWVGYGNHSMWFWGLNY